MKDNIRFNERVKEKFKKTPLKITAVTKAEKRSGLMGGTSSVYTHFLNTTKI